MQSDEIKWPEQILEKTKPWAERGLLLVRRNHRTKLHEQQDVIGDF